MRVTKNSALWRRFVLLLVFALQAGIIFLGALIILPDTAYAQNLSEADSSIFSDVDDSVTMIIPQAATVALPSSFVKGEPSNKSVTTPVGKELLRISNKEDKYAYFDTTQSYDRVIVNNAFDIGEKLSFVIRYGVIVAGKATMSIPGVKTYKNRECFRIVTEAKSNRFFSRFYKVEDRVESLMDRDGLYSWRFEKHLQEGKYRAEQQVEFDHIRRIAITNAKDTLRIPPCVQDILTAFYYVRIFPMEVGKSLSIDNCTDKKLYPLEVKVHHRERIRIRAGTFDCIVVEPMLKSDAIFKQRGRLLIWLTDDSRKIPVQMKSKVAIGSITAELEEMEGVLPINKHVSIQRN